MTGCSTSNWLIQFATDYEPVIDALGIVIIPLIAGGAITYIAWQQYKTNRQRLRFEQYERRLRIYKTVEEFLSELTKEVGPYRPNIGKLREALNESYFLFEDDIPAYLEDLRGKAVHAYEVGSGLPDVNDDEAEPLRQEWERILAEFRTQPDIARGKFRKYLKLD